MSPTKCYDLTVLARLTFNSDPQSICPFLDSSVVNTRKSLSAEHQKDFLLACELHIAVESSERQTCPVKSFICLVKDAIWPRAQHIVLSHTSDNWRVFEISSLAAYPCPGHSVKKMRCMERFDVDFSSFWSSVNSTDLGLMCPVGVAIRRLDISCSLIQASSGMQGQFHFDVLEG